MQLTNANLEIMRWFREIEREIISFTHIEISKGFWVLQGMNFPFDLYEIREDVHTLKVCEKILQICMWVKMIQKEKDTERSTQNNRHSTHTTFP